MEMNILDECLAERAAGGDEGEFAHQFGVGAAQEIGGLLAVTVGLQSQAAPEENLLADTFDDLNKAKLLVELERRLLGF